MKLFDTWAWVEYFKGGKRGERVRAILENEEICTSSISLAEISKWVYENGADFGPFLAEIKNHSVLIPLEEDILIGSGWKYVELRKTRKTIGLIDVIIYTTARNHELIVVTGDEDFKGLPGVELV
jgi:predicted nucleic acid-binding protein